VGLEEHPDSITKSARMTGIIAMQYMLRDWAIIVRQMNQRVYGQKLMYKHYSTSTGVLSNEIISE
jgi:hypothetical protein